MTEQLSFRDRQLATCREKMISTREEAVALLRQAREQSVNVGKHQFKKPGNLGHKVPQGKIGLRVVDILSQYFTQSGAKAYDPDAERQDWTQNPEFIARQFLDKIINIFQHEPVDNLMNSVEKCIAEFKSEYPHASEHIDHTVVSLLIKQMITELWKSQQLEESSTVTLAITANLRVCVKQALTFHLNN